MTTEATLPQCWQDVQDASDAGINQVILYGPPGTGKTFTGLHFGTGAGGAFRLICNEDMTSADVTGHMLPAGDTWRWNSGAVLNAWNGDGQVGGRVVADEIDRASGDVLSLLLAMFDSPESASWTNPMTQERHRPLPGFSVYMTTNLEQPEDLPTALKDRFPVAIRINQPHPDALTFLSPRLRVPAAMSADDHYGRISLRGWKAFDKAAPIIGDEKAARLVFGSLANSVLDTLRVNDLA